jgi:CubicO group peptidase (beta-lactamase class C family)
VNSQSRSLSRRRFLATTAGTIAASALATHGRRFDVLAARPADPAQIPNTLNTDASAQFKAVAEALMEAMAEAQVPGVALGIYHDGKLESGTFGIADIATNEPVSLDTRFEMGSITKTYTATAIMWLADMGFVDLEAPVRTYLPDFRLADPEVAARVTVRHLLTHTEGWYGDIIFRSPSDDDATAWLVREKLPTLPQAAPLGAFYSYNNTGFALLGRIVEVVAGMPYRKALRRIVLSPLGLKTAAFGEDALHGRFAQSHGLGKNGLEVVTPLLIPRAYEPTGGLWTTIDDQLRYARLHLGDGSLDQVRVLRPETLRLMQTPQVPMPGRPSATAGMNWLITDRDGQRRLQHAGQLFGQTAQLVLVPSEQFAVAVLTNSSSAFPAIAAAIGGAFVQYLGVDPQSTQAAAQPAPPTPMTDTQLAEYAGSYVVPDLNFTLRLEGAGLVLSAEMTPVPDQELGSLLPELPRNAPVTFVGSDSAVAVSQSGAGTAFVFVRRTDGSVGWLASDGRLYPRTGSA